MKKLFLFVLLFFLFALAPVTAASDDSLYILVVYGQSPTAVKDYVSSEDIKGATLAVEKLNARGGLLGRKLEVIDLHAVEYLEARASASKIIKEKDILAGIGANVSNLTLAIAPLFQKAGIPLISPISTNPAVTRAGDYIFRACFTDPFQGEVMARFALQDLGAKTAVLLIKVSSKFSQELAMHFRRTFEKEGKILWEGEYLIEDSNFTEILNKVKLHKPDVVFLPGHGLDSGLILKQAHSMGIAPVFLGGDGWGKGVLGVAGAEASEGNYFSNHWHMDVDSELSHEFVRAYFKKYNEQLIAASAPLAHDAVMLLADAVSRAGSLDRRKIREALAKTEGFKGITGTYTFDPNGDPILKDAVILKYEKGDIVYVKTIKP